MAYGWQLPYELLRSMEEEEQRLAGLQQQSLPRSSGLSSVEETERKRILAGGKRVGPFRQTFYDALGTKPEWMTDEEWEEWREANPYVAAAGQPPSPGFSPPPGGTFDPGGGRLMGGVPGPPTSQTSFTPGGYQGFSPGGGDPGPWGGGGGGGFTVGGGGGGGAGYDPGPWGGGGGGLPPTETLGGRTMQGGVVGDIWGGIKTGVGGIGKGLGKIAEYLGPEGVTSLVATGANVYGAHKAGQARERELQAQIAQQEKDREQRERIERERLEQQRREWEERQIMAIMQMIGAAPPRY